MKSDPRSCNLVIFSTNSMALLDGPETAWDFSSGHLMKAGGWNTLALEARVGLKQKRAIYPIFSVHRSLENVGLSPKEADTPGGLNVAGNTHPGAILETTVF